MRQLLCDRTFGLYFAGSLVNNLGTWFHSIAAILVVYDLSGSALIVGLVTGAQFAATIFLAPVAGILLDRLDRRKVMVFAQVLSAVAAAGLVVASLAQLLSVPVVLAATAIIGIGEAFTVPTKQALVPSLVEPRDIGQGLALQSLSFNVARAAGPGLGAVVVSWGGPEWAFGLNLVSYLVLIGALALIRMPGPLPATTGDRSLRAGLRYVRNHHAIRANLIALAAVSFALDPVTTVSAPLVDELGGGPGFVGLLISAFGTGAAMMALFGVRTLQRLRPTAAGTVGLVTFGAAMATASLAPSPPYVLVALAVAGAGFLLANNDLTTRIQRLVDDSLRGRVMAIWAMVLLGTRPIAGAVSGSLSDAMGPRVAMFLPAVLVLGAARLAWANRAIGRADVPEPSPVVDQSP